MIEARGIEYRSILRGVDVECADRSVTGIVGPNGAGKTTLLKCLFGALTPTAGRVRIDATDLNTLSPRELARRVAVVSQEPSFNDRLSVAELVSLGRLPHRDRRGRGVEEVATALEKVGLLGLAHRPLDQLSGGERQRAMIARALAQRPRYLLLDEPGNHLDIHHQLDLFHILREFDGGAVVVLHDLNHALDYCDEVYVLASGRVAAAGAPREVLVPEVLEPIYNVRVHRAGNHVTFTREEQP
ncbi:ABC transporter ATP-binding protein [Corynebacterium sanguinis]|uniref:ABC transporter ATP-binding protein n=1 Tax=Corynebacterium sanguinis TaxID=2594913 RepID=UPI0011A9C709|nr:ABC transporter ATP-binding protein [Corynebacterium sanguinis]MCT1413144.1 ABC transporter ATP-binding protein [Corynebacterium sanguinis]MCT1491505.1 ABC transporter ATP-binding protein [Corynebacterium sanguinis]MCT1555450.1 ABC transporter ATP-binding protein [Corynebacterium sanguinis]MCT1663116.1 ABC transporter ATP-binding protein [Corynebacterium sanguinis]MCT2246576.1 ABC transporter ATP-binding protein [Corynebacterium sanguinis]